MKADDRYDSLFVYYWEGHPVVAGTYAPAREDPGDWRRAKAVALVESSLNPRAGSQVGARGLMQLTAIAVEDLVGLAAGSVDLYNPETNIQLGIRYLLERCWQPMVQEVADSATRWAIAHAAYNAGPSRVRTPWRTVGRPLLEDGPRWAAFVAELPTETQAYLDRIQYALERV